jgi:hypothetical protein
MKPQSSLPPIDRVLAAVLGLAGAILIYLMLAWALQKL